jgi:hypothetical protein
VDTSEVYRRFAAECFRLAEQTRDPSRRATLLAMAASWGKLAEWVDRRAMSLLKTSPLLKAPKDDNQS